MKVGVVGLGRIAQMVHIPHLSELDGVEIAALCDPSPKVLSAIASRFPGTSTYSDQGEMLREGGVDAVVNCTATVLHPSTVRASLEAGLPTFVEKPLAFNPQDAEELARLAHRRDTVLAVGYHKRFDSGYLHFRQALETEEDIFYVRAHKYFGGYGAVRSEVYRLAGGDVPAGLAAAASRELDRQLGFLPADWRPAYRMLVDIASHVFNALRGLWGDPERVLYTTTWGAQERAPGAGAIPHVVSVLDYGRHRASFEFAFLPQKKFWDEDITAYAPTRILRLRFENAALQHMPAVVEVVSGVSEVQQVRIVGSHESPFRRVLAHFVDCALEGREPETSGEDARRTIDAAVAVIESARTGAPVSL